MIIRTDLPIETSATEYPRYISLYYSGDNWSSNRREAKKLSESEANEFASRHDGQFQIVIEED